MPTKNLVSDFGGVGDGQRQTVNITVTSSSPTLTVGTAIFNPATVAGKHISIWDGSNYKTGIVQASPSPTSTVVTLNSNFTWNSTASSADVLWGTDNTNALIGVSGSWRAYAITQTNPVDIPILQIPDGNYAYHASPSEGLSKGVLNSVKISGISGVAANCRLMQFDGSEMRFGGDPGIVPNKGLANSGGNSVRLLSASAGASTVTLSNPTGTDDGAGTYGSRVINGRVCLLAAFDMQGLNDSDFGYPPNSYFFEWNVITGYNSGTGVVNLQNPLSQAYKSTYPQWCPNDTSFASGHTSGADQGGPFTMWVTPDGYNNTITLENFTVDSPHNQSACHIRNWVGNNLLMNGPALYPTQNDTVTLNNCVYPQSLEIDKMTNQVTWNNCTLNILQQQSASPNKNILNGGSINQLETAKYTEANNVAFTGSGSLLVGVTSYGCTSRIVMSGCSGITSILKKGAATDDLGGSSGLGSQQNASDFYSFVGGVIKFLKTSNDSAGGHGQQNLTRCFMPGSWVTFDDKYIDQIADVYEDGTYCYVQFANTTNWPFTPVLRLKAHPCPDFSMRSCTGTAPELEDFNQAPLRTPIYSYSKRTYTDDATGTTVKIQPFVMGKLVTAKYNVTTPGSVTFNQSQFNNWVAYKTDYSTYTYPPTIACVNGGLRTVRGGTTATGGQAGDSIPDLTSIGQIWFSGGSNSGPLFSANGTNAVISVEINADQGIPPLITAGMALFGNLRLHS